MNNTQSERAVDEIQRSLELLLRLNVNRRAYEACAKAAGVTVGRASYALLSLLSRTGPLPMGQVALEAGMDRTATTRAVERLHAAGYVRRCADGRDRRRVVLAMTWRGVEAHRRMAAVMDRQLGAALRGWEAADIETFARLLAAFVEDAALHELGASSTGSMRQDCRRPDARVRALP
ncbi:MarR family winged helix-turn-helix transcriptional regulator [Uniformispora flossi]|uniref:MarR family winged helix-turn-helix transcriptional regulator n=1 Tax=Uniformispora flossi TaxID=3390723 RepID=UPI003C2F96CF